MLDLTAWTLAALLQFAPPERHAGAPWAEERADALPRYQAIAEAITSVCDSRSCAALLVSIAVGESGLAKDVDTGPCYRKGAYATRCDRGRAASVWQAQASGRDASGERLTVARLFADRSLAAWHTLRIARTSLKRCGDLSGLSGHCIEGKGTWTAHEQRWRRIAAWVPRPHYMSPEQVPK